MKVKKAAADLIVRFQGVTSPFSAFLRHLEELKTDPKWKTRELNELRLLVFRGLLSSQPRDEGILPATRKNGGDIGG